MTNKVYVIEHRIYVKGNFENVLAHVSSSREMAVQWCRDNLNYEEKDENSPWFFFISCEIVDDNNLFSNEDSLLIDWNGNVVEEKGENNGG